MPPRAPAVPWCRSVTGAAHLAPHFHVMCRIANVTVILTLWRRPCPSGLNKWVAENQALEEGWPPPTPTATTDYTITIPDNTMLVEHEVMKAKVTGASAAPVFQVLDARGIL